MAYITFDDPIFLLYLLAIPLLIYAHFYTLRRTKLKALKFANFEALKRATGDNLVTKNYTILALRLTVLICMILAITGTTYWYEGNIGQSEMVIAVDVSASMAAQDIDPTRLDAAKELALDLVDDLAANSRIGLISFSGTTIIEESMTIDRPKIKERIRDLEIAKAGGTDIPGAIISGTNLLTTTQKGRMIVLITDGSSTVSAFLSEGLDSANQYAFDNRVVVHTLGIGSNTGPIGYLPEYYNISAVYNEDALVVISNATGGDYFKINTASELESVVEQINERSAIGMVPVRLSYWLLLVSFITLFIEWGFISTRFRRIP